MDIGSGLAGNLAFLLGAAFACARPYQTNATDVHALPGEIRFQMTAVLI
jgi:hypothetical protein